MDPTIKEVRLAIEQDNDPDLSYLGVYSSKLEPGGIDRQEPGRDYGHGEYRFFNPGCGNPEYIEQDYARHEAYNRGDWRCVGLVVTVVRECSHGFTDEQTASVWGVESDYSDECYLRSTFAELGAELEQQAAVEATLAAEGLPQPN